MDETIRSIPGTTGDQESRDAAKDGGFAWSRMRAAQFGPVCRTAFKGKNAVLLTGEEGLRAFYDTRFVKRGGIKGPAELAFLSDGLTPVVPVLDDKDHVRRKGALLQAVTPKALGRYVPVLDAIVGRHVTRWQQAIEVDLIPALQALTFEALSTVILGVSGNTQQGADYAGAMQGFFGIEPASQIPARDRLLAWYRERLKLARTQTGADAESNMIGILAHQTDLSDAEIVAETQHLFIGSGGVWAATCTALVALSEHSAVIDRMRSEIIGFDAPPSLQQLDDAVWLQLVVEEALRTTPLINIQIARAAQPFDVAGYRIEQGELLIAGLYATNHDKAIYPVPDMFDPGRAERNAKAGDEAACPFSKSAPFGFVPMGGGDRRTGHRCLGEQLVYVTMKLILQHAARGHAWFLCDPEAVRSMPAAYMAPKVCARFVKHT